MTCGSGQVLLKSGQCGCEGQLKLINGNCDCDIGLIRKGNNCERLVTKPPITRPPKPPPAVKCSANQRLVSGACVNDVTTNPPSKFVSEADVKSIFN